MPERTVAIASDHAGYALKELLKEELRALGYAPLDLGAHSTESTDYPDNANALAEAMKAGKAERGIALCGSGIGISIALNRHRHLRAARCGSGLEARLARMHNDANVLVLGARVIGEEVAKDCVKEFLNAEFEGGRHQRRVEKLG